MILPTTSPYNLLANIGGRNPSDVEIRRRVLRYIDGGTYEEREQFALYGEVQATAFGEELYDAAGLGR